MGADNWIAAGIFLTGVLATVFGFIYANRGKTTEETPLVGFTREDRELLENLRRAFNALNLSPEDRSTINQLRESIYSVRNTLIRYTDAVRDLTEATRNLTRAVDDWRRSGSD